MSSLTNKILTNTFWQVLGRVATAIIGVISIKVITNYLSTDAYGQYTTLYEFIGFFAIAADFGLYTIGVREMAKQEKTESEILANILSIRLVLIILTLGLSVLAANLIPQYSNSLISQGIWIVALTTGLALLNGTLSSILQFKLQMKYANYAIIISRIISVAYILFTIFSLHPANPQQGFSHLLYAGLFANIALIAITFLFARKHTKIYFDFNWKYTKELVIKSLPYGLALILSTIYFKVDIILLSLLKDYHQVGIYGVPLKLMEILSVIPVFLLNSALPSITKNFRTDKEKFKKTINKILTFLNLLATPIMIGGIILAFPITYVIANPQFLSGHHCTNNIQKVYQSLSEATTICQTTPLNSNFQWDSLTNSTNLSNSSIYLYGSDIALKIILIAMFFSFLNSLFSFTLVAIDKQSKLINTNLMGVLFNIITNLIFIPIYGFIGAAITTVFSEIIILFGTYYYVKKFTNLELSYKNFIKTLTAGIIMGLAVYFLQPITYNFLQNKNIFLLIPIGGIIYATLIYTFKVVTNDDIKKVLQRN